MKKIPVFVFAVLTFLIAAVLPAKAETLSVAGEGKRVAGNGAGYDSVSFSASDNIKGIYIEFSEKPVDMEITSANGSIEAEGKFINRYIDVSSLGVKEITAVFASRAYLRGATCYISDPPSDVQIWDDMCDHADLMLFTTHADDEQLFFAGVLPYYCTKGYDVQVVYFTDHKNEPGRRQELLAGLWTVGVRHYPYINGLIRDAYSESVDGALANVKTDGLSYDDVVKFQTEMLRRFKPLVVVGHDFNGEYGHGQHRLNAKSLSDALEASPDETRYPDSANAYGTWDVSKAYFHLYDSEQIVMSVFDEPLDCFGGVSAFGMTQKGFQCHKSQHYTWFNNWLNGGGGITRGDQIKTYSPLRYGLYRTTVGKDEAKNDFFENIAETHKEKAARLEREENERIERERREEESRAAESLRIAEESRMLYESELAEESRIAYESLLEAEKRVLEEEKGDSSLMIPIIAVCVIAALGAVFIIFREKNR